MIFIILILCAIYGFQILLAVALCRAAARRTPTFK